MGSGLPLNVLFIVPYAPTRIRTRPFHLIRALTAVGHRLTVATVWGSEEERVAIADLERDGITVVAERLPLARALWNCCRALPSGDPLQAHYSWSPELARRLARATLDSRFDVVHVEHLRGVRYGLALGGVMAGTVRPPAMVWDSVDCISSLFRRAGRESLTLQTRAAARLELPRTERYEGSVLGRFDRVLVTSETDRRDLLELNRRHRNGGPEPSVDVVRNGVDLEYFSPAHGEPREPGTLVFTGKMSYHANATAAVRFVRDVMPAVWAALPDTRLWLVGSNPGRAVVELGKNPQVVVTGTVADIRPFLRRATLSVAPIQYGVGIQNKVLEAMACGAPTVATPQAVSALEARPGDDLVIASPAAGLAQAIVALLNDPARRHRMGRAGRAFVERQHNWSSLAAQLTGIYRDAVA